jgi:undecaprenyl diphosphate synthase
MQEAVRRAQEGSLRAEDVTEQLVSSLMTTKTMPDPDLLIRTSGEYRISNFLLWQLAYSELYFTDCLWPEFTPEEFYKAILDYQKRERRFGKTSEQITK